jgi:hypothetical protein
MEGIVIRRLRYLVDNIHELGEDHFPLLNALEERLVASIPFFYLRLLAIAFAAAEFKQHN